LFASGDFVLLCFGAEESSDEKIEEAAAKVGLPLRRVSIMETEAKKLYGHRLVLVRPDGMVAWRGDSLPDSAGALHDRVRGATKLANGF